jgi:hypothetical protein
MATSADYAVVLRDLKARRDILDAAIKALEPVAPPTPGTLLAVNPATLPVVMEERERE